MFSICGPVSLHLFDVNQNTTFGSDLRTAFDNNNNTCFSCNDVLSDNGVLLKLTLPHSVASISDTIELHMTVSGLLLLLFTCMFVTAPGSLVVECSPGVLEVVGSIPGRVIPKTGT